jgi:hypothetical protein
VYCNRTANKVVTVVYGITSDSYDYRFSRLDDSDGDESTRVDSRVRVTTGDWQRHDTPNQVLSQTLSQSRQRASCCRLRIPLRQYIIAMINIEDDGFQLVAPRHRHRCRLCGGAHDNDRCTVTIVWEITRPDRRRVFPRPRSKRLSSAPSGPS